MKIKKPTFRSLNRLINKLYLKTQLVMRWQLRKNLRKKSVAIDPIGIDQCELVYINLDKRKDRNAEILEEFQKLGIANFQRFSAHANGIGAIGCAMSHGSIIKSWSSEDSPLLMVCEDDCEFMMSKDTINAVIKEFCANPYLDVLCLGYNEMNSQQISDTLSITSNTQTTSCYLLKPHMREPMIDICNKSIQLLSQNESEKIAAIDVVWKELQQKYFFALSSKRAVTQRTSYSDIQGAVVSYDV